MNIDLLVNISRLFIPLIAIIGVFIAWQNFYTNREKIRLDLYDRRFKIYDTIISSLYESIYGAEDFTREEYSRFFTACDEANFLLPDAVCKNIDIARELMHECRNKRISLKFHEKHEKQEDKITSIKNRIMEIESEIENFHPKITSSFKEVLKFEKF